MTDWQVSVVIPHTQNSWIGKAYHIDRDLTATYYQPSSSSSETWMLLDGTPASCTNVGVHFPPTGERPDLVISGPNYGRNSSAVYILSSGTVGGAMEGALCGVRSISLSFAYEDRSREPPFVDEACERSVEVIKHLYENWSSEAQLYSINVPLVQGVADRSCKILYTHILQNTWTPAFQPIKNKRKDESKLLQFRWAPDFDAADRTVLASSGNNDALVIEKGDISVTPLKASFMDINISEKEIILDE